MIVDADIYGRPALRGGAMPNALIVFRQTLDAGVTVIFETLGGLVFGKAVLTLDRRGRSLCVGVSGSDGRRIGRGVGRRVLRESRAGRIQR